MSTAIPPIKEVDFMVLKEDWSRYLINDGTELRVRIVVKKIVETGRGDMGYPNLATESVNVVSAICPDRMKRPPSTGFNPQIDPHEEIKFTATEEKWQEYQMTNGYRLLVKPILTKVFKYDKYNTFGEPIYTTIIQSILNVEKA